MNFGILENLLEDSIFIKKKWNFGILRALENLLKDNKMKFWNFWVLENLFEGKKNISSENF